MKPTVTFTRDKAEALNLPFISHHPDYSRRHSVTGGGGYYRSGGRRSDFGRRGSDDWGGRYGGGYVSDIPGKWALIKASTAMGSDSALVE